MLITAFGKSPKTATVAVLASRIADMPKHRPKEVGQLAYLSQPEAAKILNVPERIIRSIKAVERDAPELIQKIESGKKKAPKSK